MTEIALFPLSTVLLPFGSMPLQIFEQRYLDLVADCMRSGEGFGVVLLRSGSEVSRGVDAVPNMAEIGAYARIVDFDQLPNGLLGITIKGEQAFSVSRSWREPNGLVKAEVELGGIPAAAPMTTQWQNLVDVLKGLEGHPYVQRMGLSTDYDNLWGVAFVLVQLLPLDESIKLALLASPSLEDLLSQLDQLLNQISGED